MAEPSRVMYEVGVGAAALQLSATNRVWYAAAVPALPRRGDDEGDDEHPVQASANLQVEAIDEGCGAFEPSR